MTDSVSIALNKSNPVTERPVWQLFRVAAGLWLLDKFLCSCCATHQLVFTLCVCFLSPQELLAPWHTRMVLPVDMPPRDGSFKNSDSQVESVQEIDGARFRCWTLSRNRQRHRLQVCILLYQFYKLCLSALMYFRLKTTSLFTASTSTMYCLSPQIIKHKFNLYLGCKP